MMDLFSPLNQASQINSVARIPVHKPPDPNRISAAQASARSQTNPQDTSHNRANADLAREARKAPDPDRPAGPPPSFDVSILEQELGFKQTIARLESARSQARDAEAVRLQSARNEDNRTKPAPPPNKPGPA